MIDVVGGVYRELCMHPRWDRYLGSAGRGASVIAALEAGGARLHCSLSKQAGEVVESAAALESFALNATAVDDVAGFQYTHWLSRPIIYRPDVTHPSLSVQGEQVLQFGMLDSRATVKGKQVVYDPQNVEHPVSFRVSGSTAERLALVINRHEAAALLGRVDTPERMAQDLAAQEGAEVVVIKCGPLGALVWDQGQLHYVPAYDTSSVWKIGSGDVFAASFAHAWMAQRQPASAAADLASRATAYYCERRVFATPQALADFVPAALAVSERFRAGWRPTVYLAGPFFTLGQLWVVTQARETLLQMGLKVFSPYHDVGHGSAEDVVDKDLQAIEDSELVLAVVDGLDAGTLYEIGYARAIDRPVIVYCEQEKREDQKMMEGSGCYLVPDFTSAIYRTVWVGAAL
jgi:nucleoside 2-deoxyribosyltransferase